MKNTHEIVIQAPLNRAFLTVADVTRWPEFLPHYRWNRYISKTPSGGIVKMSCTRLGLPLTWVSELQIDPGRHQLRFRHLKGVLNSTQGMDILWEFRELPAGAVRVRVTHDFKGKLPLVGPVLADKALGGFFIQDLAEKTLTGVKRKVEALRGKAAEVEIPPLEAPAPPQVKRRKILRRFSSRAGTPTTRQNPG